MIDHDIFLFAYQAEVFEPLKDHQRTGILDLLTFINNDADVTDPRWIAYMLATTKHETADTFLPIAEYGLGKGKPYGVPDISGNTFYGRGYVQLTWAANYKAMSKPVGVDLYANPTQAMVPEVAYKIMSCGMRKGAFTGVGLSKYFNETVTDPLHARKIINGMDCAEKIARYYDGFAAILGRAQ